MWNTNDAKESIGHNNISDVRKKIHLYAFVIVLFFVLSLYLIFVIYSIFNSQKPLFTQSKNSIEAAPSRELFELSLEMTEKKVKGVERDINTVRRLIDGVYVNPGEENIFPVVVMIDNNIYARPQSSLSKANLVYEAEVEGRVTRYMAVFADSEITEKIGPVRSARPYFVDWANELGALYAHVGGSPEALVQIKRDKILDINEFYNGSYYWRDWERSAPHNVYTSSELLNKYKDARTLEEGDFTTWIYKDDAPEDLRGKDRGVIDIGFKSSNFKVSWKYDKASNSYIRYQSGRAYIDSSGVGVKAKNIIIQYVSAREIDRELRLEMKHIGSGKSILCFDGNCTEGSWEKKSASDRTRYFDENANEAAFNAGTTWVEVVRSGYSVVYEQ